MMMRGLEVESLARVGEGLIAGPFGAAEFMPGDLAAADQLVGDRPRSRPAHQGHCGERVLFFSHCQYEFLPQDPGGHEEPDPSVKATEIIPVGSQHKPHDGVVEERLGQDGRGFLAAGGGGELERAWSGRWPIIMQAIL